MFRIADALWNEKNYDVVDEAYDPLVEVHVFQDEEIVGAPAVKEWARENHEAFSDFHAELFDVTAKDDRVFARYRITGTHDGTLNAPTGDVPPTHRKMDTWGLSAMRFDGGLVAEEWNSTDSMTILSQLGVTPE